MPRLSVLTSLYKSAPYVSELYNRAKAAATRITDDYEFVFVDDGSPDDAAAEVLKIREIDDRVRLVQLSRNFGQHKALMAGLAHTTGDYVFLIDSDLEEPPELLDECWRLHTEDPDADVIYAVMRERKGRPGERLGGRAFYWLLNRLSERPVPADAMAARLMTRAYVDAVLKYQETHVYLGGVMALAGFKQRSFPAEKRSKGSSTYSFRRKWALAADALFSYSARPLAWICAAGVIITVLSFMALAVLAIVGLAGGRFEPWHWALASIWFLGGTILAAVGVVGLYTGRVYIQVKGRPNVVVKRVYD